MLFEGRGGQRPSVLVNVVDDDPLLERNRGEGEGWGEASGGMVRGEQGADHEQSREADQGAEKLEPEVQAVTD